MFDRAEQGSSSCSGAGTRLRVARHALALLGMLAASTPAGAAADWCAGKANGTWCQGSTLVYCSGGTKLGAEPCQAGCTGAGPNASCKGFCGDLDCNGSETCSSCPKDCGACPPWCGDGDCNGSETCSSCPKDCGDCPPWCGDGDCNGSETCSSCAEDCGDCPPPPGFCTGKADGTWCQGDILNVCSGGDKIGAEPCAHGCEGTGPSARCRPECGDGACEPGETCATCIPDCGSCPPGGFCTSKTDGTWCNGDTLVLCDLAAVVWTKPCEWGCDGSAGQGNAACKDLAPGFCTGKVDGHWCDGSLLVQCAGGVAMSAESCPDGCLDMPGDGVDQCRDPTPSGCAGVGDGTYCLGDELVACADGKAVSKEPCEAGCVEEDAGGRCRSWCGDGQCADGEDCSSCLADCGECPPGDFCATIDDGYWCNGDVLVRCDLGSIAGMQHCAFGCLGLPGHGDDECAPPPPDPCTSKADGTWCDGEDQLLCAGGTTVGRAQCAEGCVETGGSARDYCYEPPPPGSCDGRADGTWCGPGLLITCEAGEPVHAEKCFDGCQGFGPKAHCAEPVCTGKPDAVWLCDGDRRVQCLGGREVASVPCPFGCAAGEGDRPGDATCEPPPHSACVGKPDGSWCAGSFVLVCEAGEEVEHVACEHGCEGSGGVSRCRAAPFCSGKEGDGWWCNGAFRTRCVHGFAMEHERCEHGCLVTPEPGKADCLVQGYDFCGARPDGEACLSNLLVTCRDGIEEKVLVCPQGCELTPNGRSLCLGTGDLRVENAGGCAVVKGRVDLSPGVKAMSQLDYKGVKHGDCPWSVASQGCTITSLSMLYEYLGFSRTVGGETGNSPALENAWRTEHNGYWYCNKGPDGVWQDKCCVVWEANPPGLGRAGYTNGNTKCLTPKYAEKIVNHLNGGIPVVAQVRWTATGTEQHWVLIVGADEGGLIMIDPWGGFRGHLSDGSALSGWKPYIVGKFQLFFLTDSLGLSGVELDETGHPLTSRDDRVASLASYPRPSRFDAPEDATGPEPVDDAVEGPGNDGEVSADPAVVDDARQPPEVGATPPGGDQAGSGCSAARGHVPRPAWLLAVFALLALASRRRLDAHACLAAPVSPAGGTRTRRDIIGYPGGFPPPGGDPGCGGS